MLSVHELREHEWVLLRRLGSQAEQNWIPLPGLIINAATLAALRIYVAATKGIQKAAFDLARLSNKVLPVLTSKYLRIEAASSQQVGVLPVEAAPTLKP